MRTRPSSDRSRREIAFLLLCTAAAGVCAALAVWFAVPLQPDPPQTTPDLRQLSSYVQVDLNTADAAGLCTLPGVGERRAEAILAYRAEHGPFAQVEDVMQVPGITQEIVDLWSGRALV